MTVGQVVSKDFEPEHEVDDSTTITVGDITVPIDSSYTVPDRWTVTIQSLADSRESTYEIDQATYDRIRLNEYYRIGMPCSSPQRPTEWTSNDGGWHR